MNPLTVGAIYLTLWWTVLFVVLPLGSRSHHEENTLAPGGGDPGSPVNHNMKRKLWTTTWVSAVLFVVLMIALRLFWPGLQEVAAAS